MRETVTLDDVWRVARLARLGLTDEQARAVTRDLNTILEHMIVLSGVDTTGVPEYTAAPAAMPLRPDHGHGTPLAIPPETFALPMRDGFFVVPRLATHEDPEP